MKIYDLVGRCDENSGRDGAGYFVVVMNLKRRTSLNLYKKQVIFCWTLLIKQLQHKNVKCWQGIFILQISVPLTASRFIFLPTICLLSNCLANPPKNSDFRYFLFPEARLFYSWKNKQARVGTQYTRVATQYTSILMCWFVLQDRIPIPLC